jgi:hypothetical protein
VSSQRGLSSVTELKRKRLEFGEIIAVCNLGMEHRREGTVWGEISRELVLGILICAYRR